MAALTTYYAELPSSFLERVEQAAERLGIGARWLMAVMDFETGGSFDPSVRNPYSGFVGLIQFGPDAAADLGTTTNQLALMTRAEQMEYVEDYFALRQRQFGALRSLEDAYMAVLWPAAIGKPAGYVLFAVPETAYAQNDYLDLDSDLAVTKAEAAAPVRKRLRGGAFGGGAFGGGLGSTGTTLFLGAGLGLLALGLVTYSAS